MRFSVNYRWLVLLTAALGCVCARQAGRTPSPEAACATRPSHRAIAGIDSLLRPGNILVFGEGHGMAQGPAFLSDVVCAGTRAGVPVVLALEIPVTEQPRIDAFLTSAGTAEDRARLLDGPFWTKVDDGRTSVAMVRLLEDVRAGVSAGARTVVVAFDVGSDVPTESWWGRRDRLMADALGSKREKHPRAATVVLVGSVHASRARGVPWDSAYAPMVHLLAARVASERLWNFRMSHEGGSAWQCREAPSPAARTLCQAYTVRPEPGAPPWTVVVAPERSDGAWSGHWGLGPVVASEPAVGRSGSPRDD